MKTSILLFAAVSTFALLGGEAKAQQANNDGIIVYEVPEGGFRYQILKEGLDTVHPFGSVRADGYDIPIDWSLRVGCAVSTKWIPVEHDAGNVTFHPHIHAVWHGELGGPNGLTAPLFDFRTEVKKADGSTRQYRRYLDTGSMRLQLRATSPEGIQSYVGELSNPSDDGLDDTFGSTVPVGPGDSVRLLVCDVWPGVSVSIRDIDAFSIPVSQ